VGIASYYVLGCVLWLAEAVTSVSAGYQLVAAGSLTRSRFTLEKVSSWKALDVIDVCGVSHDVTQGGICGWKDRTAKAESVRGEFSKVQSGFGSTQPFTLSLSSCETDGVLC